MADISQALDAVRDAIASVLYPSGIPSGPRPMSAAGGAVRIYVGWPGTDLDEDLAAGIAHVTVWPRPGVAAQMSQYIQGWQEIPGPTPSLTATVVDATVTFGGDTTVPRMYAAIAADGANGDTWIRAIQPGDTPNSIAAWFASQISPHMGAVASGPSVTMAGHKVGATVMSGGWQFRERRRQRQAILVTIWSPTQALRDAIAILIDEMFEDNRTLVASDGSLVTVFNDGTVMEEAGRRHPLRRRDLMLNIEFSMRQVKEAEPVVAVVLPGLGFS